MPTDFTVRLAKEKLADYCQMTEGTPAGCKLKLLDNPPDRQNPDTWRYSGQLPVRVDGAEVKIFRSLICRVDEGAEYSATFRKLDTEQASGTAAPALDVRSTPPTRKPDSPAHTKYRHEDKPEKLFPMAAGGYLFGVQHMAHAIGERLSDTNSGMEAPLDGLIVVTGRTGAAKSRVAERIIDDYLNWCWSRIDPTAERPMRRPHLIALQDPIENRFVPQGDHGGIDYTPRALGLDYWSLEEALEDALRQTPALLYVGEVRQPSDWKAILRFAGSGHLCVTTAHAGSLVEAMRGLMDAAPARTADERSSLARKILAVIHLRSASDHVGNGKFSYSLPSMWCRGQRSVASFVSDGLASILPHRRAGNSGPSRGCFGRQCFAESLFASRAEDFNGWNAPVEVRTKVRTKVRSQAAEWDLNGE